MRRRLLRSHLTAAWRQTIEDSYQGQLINSERGLKVFFCAALTEAFKEDQVRRRIFVEPCLSRGAGESKRYPDIVICNQRSVIGIVELKYRPKGRAPYQKDLVGFPNWPLRQKPANSRDALNQAPPGCIARGGKAAIRRRQNHHWLDNQCGSILDSQGGLMSCPRRPAVC